MPPRENMADAAEAKYMESQNTSNSINDPTNSAGPPVPSSHPQVIHQTIIVQQTNVKSPRGICDTYILAIALGWMGAHHFYLRRPGWGCLYLFTFGLLGVGWLIDLCRVPCLVSEANKQLENPVPMRKNLFDAYVLWFPFGLFGAHHFYLRRWGWGVGYLLTFGLLGIGWLIDGIRMRWMVRDANIKLADIATGRVSPATPRERRVCDAYVLTLFPFTGLLGGQHYYLGRVEVGLAYTFTLGFLGVGYIVDWFRMFWVVKDVNKSIAKGERYDSCCCHKNVKRRLDDCYLMLFPLGFLGLHHFYLHRPGWGCLYFFTFGCLGIGWLIDFIRLPCLVRDHNKNIDKQGAVTVIQVPAGQMNQGCDVLVHPQVPPYSANPEVLSAGSLGPNYSPYPPNPGYYGAVGQSSWSTIASSDVGMEAGGDNPPSYEIATGPNPYHPNPHPTYPLAGPSGSVHPLPPQPAYPHAQPSQVHAYPRLTQAPEQPATDTKKRDK